MADQASYGRTKKSIRNSIVALTIQFLAMLAGFFSRKIFIDHLGTEVMGLNSTSTSILNFLNIVELGIWSAISVTLYKPLHDRDEEAVKEIIAIQGWLYKIIASIVMIGSIVVMFFIPRIFSKSDLPIWYPYSTFIALLYSSLLTYLANYKRNVLYADQQNYKVLMCSRLVSLFKLILQAFAVYYSENGYIWWLGLEVVFATIGAILTRIIVYKAFPYLKEPVENVREIRNKYPGIKEKIRFLAFHKLGNFAKTQASPIIIYAFASLTMVALYGNYLILTTNLVAVFAALYSGIEASIGNMVSEGDRKLVLKVFGELFSFRFLLTSFSCLCLWVLSDPFISVWIGPQYVMGKSTLALIVIGFFLTNTSSIVYTYVNALGVFSDIWAPVVEGLLNVSLSILFGWIYGLNGILFGALMSQIIIGFIWKPYFLFQYGLEESVSIYVKMYIKHFLLMLVSAIPVIFLLRYIKIDPSEGLFSFLIYSGVVASISLVIMSSVLYIAEKSIRGFLNRVLIAFFKR